MYKKGEESTVLPTIKKASKEKPKSFINNSRTLFIVFPTLEGIVFHLKKILKLQYPRL
jgi:hypothetical protein